MSFNAICGYKILKNISGFTVVLSFNFQHGCHTLLCPFGSVANYGSCIDIAIEIQGQAVSVIFNIILLPYVSILNKASTSPYESFMSSLCLAFLEVYLMRRSRRGQRVRTSPTQKRDNKNTGFLSITCPDHMKKQSSIQCWVIISPPVKRHVSLVGR